MKNILCFLLAAILLSACQKEDPSIPLQARLAAELEHRFAASAFPFVRTSAADSLFIFSPDWRQSIDSLQKGQVQLKLYMDDPSLPLDRQVELQRLDSMLTERLLPFQGDSLLLPFLDPFLLLDTLFYQTEEMELLANRLTPFFTQLPAYQEGLKASFRVASVPALEHAIRQYEKHFFWFQEEVQPYLGNTLEKSKWNAFQPLLSEARHSTKDYLAWLVSRRWEELDRLR